MPGTLEALVILVLLIVPGFLFARLIKAPVPGSLISERQFLVVALLFSIVVHVLVLPYTISQLGGIVDLWKSLNSITQGAQIKMEVPVFFWLLMILFIIPALAALIVSSLWRAEWTQPFLDKVGLSLVEMTPQAWDWFFLTQRKGCWIVVEFIDGELRGGEYGTASFASLTPHSKDLFIEGEYYIDEEHNFLNPVPESVGMWVNGANVRALHFYRSNEEQQS